MCKPDGALGTSDGMALGRKDPHRMGIRYALFEGYVCTGMGMTYVGSILGKVSVHMVTLFVLTK